MGCISTGTPGLPVEAPASFAPSVLAAVMGVIPTAAGLYIVNGMNEGYDRAVLVELCCAAEQKGAGKVITTMAAGS